MSQAFGCRVMQRVLAACLIGGAATIAACSGSHDGTHPLPPAPLRPFDVQRQTNPNPTPYQFSFTTVDDPKSSTFTRLHGLDDLGQVVGSVEISQSGNTSGLTSANPYENFPAVSYPNAKSTVAAAVNPGGKIIAGYFVSGKNGGTWGFIRKNGYWQQYKDPNTPKGTTSVNELLGVNDNAMAVGFYVDASGNNHAYELANRKFVNIVPPKAVSAEATAITLAGNIAGTETLADGTTEGWILRSGNYDQFSFPGSSNTQVNGMSDGISDNVVVGSYVDSSGAIHGFTLTHPGNPSTEVWQSVDEPNAAGTTVITGMNNHRDISGWYVDANGNTNGFIATTPK